MEKKRTVKGIKIRIVNYFMIIVVIVIYSLVLWKTIDTRTYYTDFAYSTQEYVESHSGAIEMRMGSDYLTSQARLFSVTHDINYSDNYFYESEINRRRDRAIETIKQHTSDDELLNTIETALKKSNKLMEKEIYSMRLVAEGMHDDISRYNRRVQECSLTAEDSALGDNEKLNLAEEMLLNEEYQNEKEEINLTVNSCIDKIIKNIHSGQIDSSVKLEHTLWFLLLFTSLLLIISLVIFRMISILVINPIDVYMKCIKAGKPLEMSKAYEFNYLAQTYNNIYELNEENKNLQYTAEHDSLTGLLNRGAFDDFTEIAGEKETSLALLFFDIDNFKEINDTYGHAAGDAALKKLADILSEKFRATDCIARLGGDEFVVIMMNVMPDIKNRIYSTVIDINKQLQSNSDNIPAFSVSAGIAFSEKGYSKDLYNHADEALYKAKSDGRRKCRFYEDIKGK